MPILSDRTTKWTKRISCLWIVLVLLVRFFFRFMERHNSDDAMKTVVEQYLHGHKSLFLVIVLLLPAIVAYAIADTSQRQRDRGDARGTIQEGCDQGLGKARHAGRCHQAQGAD